MSLQKPREKFVALDKEQDAIMANLSAKKAPPGDRARLEIIEEEMMMLKSALRGTEAEASLRKMGVW